MGGPNRKREYWVASGVTAAAMPGWVGAKPVAVGEHTLMRRPRQSGALQASVNSAPGAREGIRPDTVRDAAQRPRNPHQPGGHADAQRNRQRLPVAIAEAQPVGHFELAREVETDDVILPPGIDRVP